MQFETLLEEAVRVHGHLCAGQVLGVRMALAGLREAGITDPRGADRKQIIVFVEMDRCATDAVQSVTGCSLGRRTMKFMDFGKMAATFINLRTGRAVRVAAREDARVRAQEHAPEAPDKYAAQTQAYRTMSEAELFDISEVRVNLRPEDLPGRPLGRVACEECGEHVQDGREVRRGGRTLCRACAGEGYYEPVDPQAGYRPHLAREDRIKAPHPALSPQGGEDKGEGWFFLTVRYAKKS